ncbi:MAG: carbohydrate ABC transporter permease [Chloroflexota bacterium]
MPEDAIENLPDGLKPGPPEGWERAWWRPMNYGLAMLVVALFGVPLIWMIATSLRPLGMPPATQFEWLPPMLSLTNYPQLFRILEIGLFARNSVMVVLIAVPLTLLTASLAGFALAELGPRLRGILVTVSVIAMLVPAITLWITRFLVFKWVGILDTPMALIAPAIMGTSPLFVLMFAWAFQRLPRELIEQAMIDGASPWRVWWTLALPLVRPITLAVAILSAKYYWSDFISPLFYIQSQEFYTLPIGLQALQQMDRTNWPLLMAGSVLLTLPVLVVFILAQRYFFQEERQRGWLEQR